MNTRISTGPAPFVLIVDDDEELARLIEKVLRREGHATAVALSGEAAILWLKNHHADLILLDLKLPDFHGEGLLDRLAQISCAVPYIIITGQGDERVAVDMMKRGALDYLVKDVEFLEFVPAVVQRSLAQLDQERRLAAAESAGKRLEQEILSISEREQRRVGEDLHDGLSQVLSAIAMLSEVLQQRLTPVSECNAEVASTISRHAHEACELARRLARGLSPVDVETNGLCHALKELAEHTAMLMKAECVFQCHDPVRIEDLNQATHLYRIAQEAINNALKHGKARKIVIQLKSREEGVELKITDDGLGFDPESPHTGGMGLRNMKLRAAAIGARFNILSASKRGTEVICTLATG